MSIRTDHEKEFISLFNSIARGTRRLQVFTDFISCSVIAIQNGLQFCEKREKKYMAIVARYKKEDVSSMARLLAYVVNGLEEKPCDFLGRIYMLLELGDKGKDQYFTPWSVALMMAQMQLGRPEELFRGKPFITFAEPACSAGAMTLAFAYVLRQAGYSSHRHMWVSVTDIDPLAAAMAYIQLSLCGIADEDVIGNALCDERRRVLLTPVHYWEGWFRRLQKYADKQNKEAA
ncbi:MULTISPECIES: type I restriction-modification system subunit M [Pantoea]|uniref:type I restriction-modification system subunit M n=1 Tax=Pantoea TaxID=53335 RepID=UPI0006A1146C|nr:MULTISPECIES: type I restriction-modification system subunit M [Pantoea]KNA27276.1 integrase [Pantoea ananatis]WRH11915.1 SAM-dependent DNA methyltransferase [Pantoea sp. JZ2]